MCLNKERRSRWLAFAFDCGCAMIVRCCVIHSTIEVDPMKAETNIFTFRSDGLVPSISIKCNLQLVILKVLYKVPDVISKRILKKRENSIYSHEKTRICENSHGSF